MGTFTAQYFVRKFLWEKRGYWTASIFVVYFARCWQNAGYHKAQMMKGHSQLFASHRQQLPSGADSWKY